MTALLDRFHARLRLPLIAAPMLAVSGPELVTAACRAGVIGAFPAANCRTIDELDSWLATLRASLGADAAPFCPNLIMRRQSMREELDCLVRNRVEMVITSVGSPAPAIGPLNDIGCLVLADVATLRHAEKALEAGAHGLILLSAGAGGQTGWVNGLAFVRAVRQRFDCPVVLAGGISDGHALFAARAAGCDLAYMGTRFLAATESRGAAAYKQMLVDSQFDDVMTTRAFTGLDTNMLVPSIVAAGLDPRQLPADMSTERAAAMYGRGARGPTRWRDIWSAGHTVSGVHAVEPAKTIIARTAEEYRQAKAQAVSDPFPQR
ncbi:MAG: nitronate monooxygenase [Pseudomonadales bacterium]|nr:nitronate monooxygenase [Pseudomonadales bacterium]MCP5183851.1 nitronate monooxygenase [Pseudomonadales bacterium]